MTSVHHSVKLLILTLAGFIGLNASIASAESIWNQKGDYRTNIKTSAYTTWQIVDPDPNGLNCRMAHHHRPAHFESQDKGSTSIEGNRHNIGNWPVLLKLRNGTRLNAPLTGRAGESQKIILDENGRPWLALNTYLGACLVRANSQYIQPIPASRKTFPR